MSFLRGLIEFWRRLWQGSDFGKDREFGGGHYSEGSDITGSDGSGGSS